MSVQTRHDSKRGCGWLTELAWSAGFFDGEGSAYLNVRTGRISRPHLTISQVTEEPLIRFRNAMGFGKIYGPYIRTGNRQRQWVYRAHGFEHLQATVVLLWAFLCSPKRIQLTRVLNLSRPLPLPRRITGAELASYRKNRKAGAQ